MTIFRSFFVLALVAAAGCSQSSVPAAPSAPTQDQIAGQWNLAFVRPAGEAAQAAPSDAPYTLAFADNRVSTRVDCNVCTGPFALVGDALTTGPALACTRAACPTMAFGDVYTALLTGTSKVTLAGDTLVLSSARGVLHFTRSAVR
jgi:heat shock protein HslJ